MTNPISASAKICAEIAFAKEGLAHFSTKITDLEEKRKLFEDEQRQIEFIDKYLAAGHGRGRLISKATTYDGKVGYFCVTKLDIDGVRRDSIIFACAPHDDILITDIDMPIDESGFPVDPRNKR